MASPMTLTPSRLVGVLFFLSLPITGLTIYYPGYLHHIGVGPATTGTLLAAAGIAGAAGLFVGGRLADRVGREQVLLTGAGLMAAGSVLLAISSNPAALLLGALAGGVGYTGSLAGGLFQSCFSPILAGLAKPGRRTEAMARAELAWALSAASGALVAGLPSLLSGPLPDWLAWRAPFWVTAISASAGVCLLLAFGTRARPTMARPAPEERRLGRERARVLKLAAVEVVHGAAVGILTLLPLWLALRFGLGVGQVSLAYFAAQAAGVLMLLALPALAVRFGDGRSVVVLCILDGILILAVAVSQWALLAVALLVVRSGVNSMFWAIQHSLFQGLVRPQLRATATSIILGSWTVGTGLLPAAAGYGLARGLLVPTLAAAGVLVLLVAALWSRVLRPDAIRDIETQAL